MTKYLIDRYLFFLASVADLYTIWQIMCLPVFTDGLWCWIAASVAVSALAIIYFHAKKVDGGDGPNLPPSGGRQLLNIYNSVIVDSTIYVS